MYLECSQTQHTKISTNKTKQKHKHRDVAFDTLYNNINIHNSVSITQCHVYVL